MTQEKLKELTSSLSQKLRLGTVFVLPSFLPFKYSFSLSTALKFIYISNRSMDRFTLYHELGHIFFFTHRSLINKRKYEQFFMNPKEFVTGYAKTGPEEDFADTFAIALADVLKKDKTEYDSRYLTQKLAFVRGTIRKITH